MLGAARLNWVSLARVNNYRRPARALKRNVEATQFSAAEVLRTASTAEFQRWKLSGSET